MRDIDAIGKPSSPGDAWSGCCWNALECVFLVGAAGGLGQRGAGLLVWQIWLPRVGEQREYGSNTLSGAVG